MNKLLIVDDSNIIRSRIERAYVNNKNIRVVAKAPNGKIAVEYAKEYKPNIVTMDLTMPSMDGIQCIEALIKIDPSIKIIVISALSDKATGIQALSKGARGFLCKPFTDQDLITAMDKVINSKARLSR